VNWKSTGEKTGGVGRASKLLSDNSPVDFATPGEYFAEKPDKENESDFFFIHPVKWSQRVKQRVVWLVNATEISLQTTN
jgi:hypothetical protein